MIVQIAKLAGFKLLLLDTRNYFWKIQWQAFVKVQDTGKIFIVRICC